MPFTSNDQLPKGVKSLPPEQQSKWRKVFNSAYEGTCKDREDRDECASKIAWSQVSKSLCEFSMLITKTSKDPQTGEMRWTAVCSDTQEDSYGEKMSLKLFNNFIKRANARERPPEEHCTDYWCGGLPYLSVAHYRDQNGLAVPGEVKKVYIDGNRFKSSGVFYDTPMGRAAYKASSENKDLPEDERVRISIGFLDFEHAHGDAVFRRRNLSDICPMCMVGAGEKQYLDGLLIHEAMTRVPVNTRTIIDAEVERSMDDIRTRKDDAASIVGDEIAEELEKRAQTSVMKSEAELVIKSDVEGCETCDQAKVEPEIVEEGHPAEVAVEKSEDGGYALPFGGATSFEEYESFVAAQEEISRMYDAWYTMEALATNIMVNDACEDKKKAMTKLLSDCKKRMEMKSLAVLSRLEDFDPSTLVERSAPTNVEAHPLDEFVKGLKAALDEVLKSGLPMIEKLQAIQPEYARLGEQVKALVEQSEVKRPEAEVVAPADTGIETLRVEVRGLSDQIAMLTSQLSEARKPQSVVSLPPHRNAAANPQIVRTLQQLTSEKPGSLKSLVRRSVGLNY